MFIKDFVRLGNPLVLLQGAGKSTWLELEKGLFSPMHHLLQCPKNSKRPAVLSKVLFPWKTQAGKPGPGAVNTSLEDSAIGCLLSTREAPGTNWGGFKKWMKSYVSRKK